MKKQRVIDAAGRFASIEPREYLMSKIKIDPVSGCWNWIGNIFKETGYGQFKNRAIQKNNLNAHRAAWIILKGPIPSRKVFVCHKCDNRRCCNPDHLFLGTQKANMEDCVEKARINRGEDRPQSRLTEDMVREARRLRQNQQIPWRDLAKRYNVTLFCVISAVKGLTWKHVDEPVPTVVVKSGGDRLSPEAVQKRLNRKICPT